MNIKFVLIGLMIIGGLIFFNDHHFKSKMKEQFRDAGKNLNSDSGHVTTSMDGYHVDVKLLNQYPSFIVNLTLSPFTATQLPEKLKERINFMVCDPDNITSKADGNADLIQAKIQVIAEDSIKWTSVHDKFHRTLILSGFCLLKIAKISLNSSFFPKPIKR